MSFKEHPGRTVYIESNCPGAHKFSYAAAQKGSQNTPCTNVPLECTLCPRNQSSNKLPVIWKYNMRAHIKISHPEHWDGLLDVPIGLDSSLKTKIEIQPTEFIALGVPVAVAEAGQANDAVATTSQGRKRKADGVERRGKRRRGQK